MSRAAVMGSGSWGTAFAMVMADAGSEVALWTRDENTAVQVNREHRNERYQPGITLPDTVVATTDVEHALSGADLVVLALPAQVAREHLESWTDHLPQECVLVSLVKGIELGTTRRMSEVIEEVTHVGRDRIAVVSGPNLAREIAEHQPTASTIASRSAHSVQLLADACTTDYFRPYWTTDVVGTEIGGAVKNVIALANGMAVGMGLGENSQASLITRGLAEMTRLGVALGADPMTFLGLAGVGDLVATCQSPLSRNRTFGVNLGRGMTVQETIEATQQTCEGYKSCQPILALAQAHGVDMPITEQVVEVLHRGRSPKTLISFFMARDTKRESALPH